MGHLIKNGQNSMGCVILIFLGKSQTYWYERRKMEPKWFLGRSMTVTCDPNRPLRFLVKIRIDGQKMGFLFRGLWQCYATCSDFGHFAEDWRYRAFGGYSIASRVVFHDRSAGYAMYFSYKNFM